MLDLDEKTIFRDQKTQARPSYLAPKRKAQADPAEHRTAGFQDDLIYRIELIRRVKKSDSLALEKRV